jgi:serine/threonine protein kinase
MTNRIGQQLGSYRLTRLLGQGGFADVYLGEHIHLNTQAAIKVLQTRLVGSNMEQFRHEAQTIASIVHPHIVRILDFGVEDGIPFLVMEYAPKGTLRQCHPKGTRLSSASIVPYVTQVAIALQYAHDRKLIHRDVKPENMLLGLNDDVWLSDFGLVLLAQSTGSQTTKEMAGTILYMAPEQINGKPRLASDQYSLGIVIYEWLSGVRPFQGSLVEIATQHLVTPPTPLHGRVPDISPALEEVVFTALAKEPQQRFASMLAFANAFKQASLTVQSDSLTVSKTIILSSKSALSTFVNPSLGQSSRSTPLVPAPSQPAPLRMVNGSPDQSSQSTFVHTPLSQPTQPPFAFTSPLTAVVPTPNGTQPLKQDLPSSMDREDRTFDIPPQTTFVSKSVAPQEQTDRPKPLSAQAFPALILGGHRLWLVALTMVLALILIGVGLVVVGKPSFGRINLITTTAATSGANPTATSGANPTAISKLNPTATSGANPTATSGANPTATSGANPTATSGANPAATSGANPTATPTPTSAPPNPTAYPPAGWKVALSDPLSTPGNWQNGSDPRSGSSCQFNGGTYHIQAQNMNYFCTGPAPVFSDLAFEVHMTIIQGSCGGIWFRGNYSAATPAYFFQVCQDQGYALFLFGSSGIQTLLSNTSSAIHAGLNQSNLIAVVTIGNHFDLYVNQQNIGSISDSTLSSGQINIAAVGGNNLTEVVYSDAKAWTP